MKDYLDSNSNDVKEVINELCAPNLSFWLFKCSCCDHSRDKSLSSCKSCFVNSHLLKYEDN